MEAKTKLIKSKRVISKSFLSENIDPNNYTTRFFLSAIHIYIHISIRKLHSGDRVKTQSYKSTSTSHGDQF